MIVDEFHLTFLRNKCSVVLLLSCSAFGMHKAEICGSADYFSNMNLCVYFTILNNK